MRSQSGDIVVKAVTGKEVLVTGPLVVGTAVASSHFHLGRQPTRRYHFDVQAARRVL
jgi:hypothetical protein